MYVSFLQVLSPEWNSIPVFTPCLFGCIWFRDSTPQELTIFFLLTMLSQATTIHLYLLASFDHLLSHTVIRYYSILLGKKSYLPLIQHIFSSHYLVDKKRGGLNSWWRATKNSCTVCENCYLATLEQNQLFILDRNSLEIGVWETWKNVNFV